LTPLENTRSLRLRLCAPATWKRRWADTPIDRGLRYLKLRFPAAEAWQLSAVGTKDFVSPEGIRACPALELLHRLP